MRDMSGRHGWEGRHGRLGCETWDTKMGDRSGKTSGRHGRHGWEIEVGDMGDWGGRQGWET